MGNYMPTTDGVRDTYLRAMRTPDALAEFDAWFNLVEAACVSVGRLKERERIIALLETRHEDYAITGHREDDCFACEHIALIKGEKQ